MVRYRGLVTLWRAIGAYPATFDMRCSDGQNIPFKFTSRKSQPGMLRIGRWMRTSVHPKCSQALGDLPIHFDGDQPLSVRVSLFPDPIISRSDVEIRRHISRTLMLAQGDSRCRPG